MCPLEEIFCSGLPLVQVLYWNSQFGFFDYCGHQSGSATACCHIHVLESFKSIEYLTLQTIYLVRRLSAMRMCNNCAQCNTVLLFRASNKKNQKKEKELERAHSCSNSTTTNLKRKISEVERRFFQGQQRSKLGDNWSSHGIRHRWVGIKRATNQGCPKGR